MKKNREKVCCSDVETRYKTYFLNNKKECNTKKY